ncbi:hypothetical protein BGX33_000669 [Mortierella sp. NVP41]|nr:hypothetical protein BGX33_000669 [Mortierella sp. NVP41]
MFPSNDEFTFTTLFDGDDSYTNSSHEPTHGPELQGYTLLQDHQQQHQRQLLCQQLSTTSTTSAFPSTMLSPSSSAFSPWNDDFTPVSPASPTPSLFSTSGIETDTETDSVFPSPLTAMISTIALTSFPIFTIDTAAAMSAISYDYAAVDVATLFSEQHQQEGNNGLEQQPQQDQDHGQQQTSYTIMPVEENQEVIAEEEGERVELQGQGTNDKTHHSSPTMSTRAAGDGSQYFYSSSLSPPTPSMPYPSSSSHRASSTPLSRTTIRNTNVQHSNKRRKTTNNNNNNNQVYAMSRQDSPEPEYHHIKQELDENEDTMSIWSSSSSLSSAPSSHCSSSEYTSPEYTTNTASTSTTNTPFSTSASMRASTPAAAPSTPISVTIPGTEGMTAIQNSDGTIMIFNPATATTTYRCGLCPPVSGPDHKPSPSYGRIHDLKRHQTVKHQTLDEEDGGQKKRKAWDCEFCRRPFVRRDALLRHYTVKASREDGLHPRADQITLLTAARARAKLV